MKKHSYILVGQILEELKDEGLTLARVTFYRLEKLLELPPAHRTASGWRTYTREQADKVKDAIKENYSFVKNAE